MNGFLSQDVELNKSSEKEVFNMAGLIDSVNMSIEYHEQHGNDDLPF